MTKMIPVVEMKSKKRFVIVTEEGPQPRQRQWDGVQKAPGRVIHLVQTMEGRTLELASQAVEDGEVIYLGGTTERKYRRVNIDDKVEAE